MTNADTKPKLEKLAQGLITLKTRKGRNRWDKKESEITVAGWTLGQFGIAEFPAELEIGGWSVTHLASGMGLQGYAVENKRAAIQLLRIAHRIVGDTDLFAKTDEAESIRHSLKTAVRDWENS